VTSWNDPEFSILTNSSGKTFYEKNQLAINEVSKWRGNQSNGK
jgi:hypothetical protein